MLIKILNLFNFFTKPYKGSSDTFVDISNRINDEFKKQKPDLQRIMKLMSILASIATTKGDADIIRDYQARVRTLLALSEY